MKKTGFLLLLTLFPAILWAQSFSIDFDRSKIGIQDSCRYVKGIKGLALDLTQDAPFRKPFSPEGCPVDFNRDFTATVWVKTNPGVCDAKMILSTIDPEKKSGGFSIETTSSGSWCVRFGDGSNQWEYRPTVHRQPVNDGRWHMLALSLNRKKSEARIYYDGINVAVYNTADMNELPVSSPLQIGGLTDEKRAFNGYLDEIELTPSVLSAEELFQKCSAYVKVTEPKIPQRVTNFKMMAFNIWNGGRGTGEQVGVERIIDIIKGSDADVVGMIETYGSGALIADALGYYFYLHGSNLAIFSRYPIVETYDYFRSYNCSAATLQVSRTQQIHYFNIWLHYLPATNEQIKTGVSAEDIEKLEWTTRARELKSILSESDSLINSGLPVFVSGDFNIDSHLDWTEGAKESHSGYVINWPTSKQMYAAGFIDSYRKKYPDPVAYPCKTWSPMWKDELQYRIDFIYYKGVGVDVIDSRMIDKHPVRFPSDHAAMISTFKLPVK